MQLQLLRCRQARIRCATSAKPDNRVPSDSREKHVGPSYFRERFAFTGASRLGSFLSLIALTVPWLISNSPWQDGHLRLESRMTVCIEVKTISLLQSGQVKGCSKKSSLTGRTAKSYQKMGFR
jgi:hypothetical protein